MATATTSETGTPRPDATPEPEASGGAGIAFPRVFSRAGVDPFDDIEWETRSAVIGNERGEVVFEQRGVEMPKPWSQQATNIVVSKYFRGQLGSPSRERDVRQLIGRVVDTIGRWADDGDYFATSDDRQAFTDDLKYLLLHQKAAFNSPVWFNCGFEAKPQCSACFINSVDDTMESILTLARTEGMLFKFGSGTGTNLSPIRSSRELLAGGGTASGPVSFMKGYDAFAGCHQVRREDAPRGQDGHSQRRPSRRARVHQLQGRGGAQGLGADRRRLRRVADRSGVRLGLLPELEQQPPRAGCVHASGSRRRRVADAGRLGRPPDRRHASGSRPDAGGGGGDARLRRSRGCSSTPPSTTGTPAPTPPGSTRRTPVRSTCSSTIRRATSPR